MVRKNYNAFQVHLLKNHFQRNKTPEEYQLVLYMANVIFDPTTNADLWVVHKLIFLIRRLRDLSKKPSCCK